jgi:hypothetical protein
MNLEEMQQKWSEMDAKLDRSLRLNEQLLTETKLKGARSALGRLRLWLGIEAALWLLWAMALGGFIYNHLGMPRFAAAAVATDVFVIVNLIATIRQIVMAGRVNYAQPVTGIQTDIQKLRMFRIRYISGAVLLGIVLWTPAAIVCAEAFFGIDLYALFGLAWIWSNIAFGIAAAALVFWAAKRFSSRLSGSSFMQRLADDIAGVSLKKAANALTAIREFAS